MNIGVQMKAKSYKIIIITILIISLTVIPVITGCKTDINEVEEVIPADAVKETEESQDLEKEPSKK